MHTQEKRSTPIHPAWNPIDLMQMTNEDLLIAQGLERGIAAMTRTHGLTVNRSIDYDVLAVALVRLFEQLPACAEPYRVLDALNRRAITLADTTQEIA